MENNNKDIIIYEEKKTGKVKPVGIEPVRSKKSYFDNENINPTSPLNPKNP